MILAPEFQATHNVSYVMVMWILRVYDPIVWPQIIADLLNYMIWELRYNWHLIISSQANSTQLFTKFRSDAHLPFPLLKSVIRGPCMTSGCQTAEKLLVSLLLLNCHSSFWGWQGCSFPCFSSENFVLVIVALCPYLWSRWWRPHAVRTG